MTIVNNETISKLIGKDIAEFAIGDDITASYVRHLRDENLRLRAEVEEANENASWWNNRFNAVNRDKTLYRHRLETANEYIESRKENMIIDHYNDLKYILNECDLESSW